MSYIKEISEQKKEAILNKSAYVLPDNPTAFGMSPSEIKEYLHTFVTDADDSVLSELARVIAELNKFFDNELFIEKEPDTAYWALKTKSGKPFIRFTENGDFFLYALNNGEIIIQRNNNSHFSILDSYVNIGNAKGCRLYITRDGIYAYSVGGNKIMQLTAEGVEFFKKITEVTDQLTANKIIADKIGAESIDATTINAESLKINNVASQAFTGSDKTNLDENTANRHTHDNKSVLDDFNGIEDSFESNSNTKALSANKGRELKNLIDAKETAKVYSSISSMIEYLNSLETPISDFRVGYNLLIVDTEVPDFYITEISSEKVLYEYTDDNAFVESVKNAPVQVGWYKISLLETQKVDLKDYVTGMTLNGKNVPKSGKNIVLEADSEVKKDSQNLIQSGAVEQAFNDFDEKLKDSGIVCVTYSELKNLRDTSQLLKGGKYRITDYECTTTQENTRSAGHNFDIIVTADDVNVLNENARAIRHAGDRYFAESNLEAWELKYCLDNDTTRFGWADTTNGKGVIYYLKDERGNECSYDFKNIQFRRYRRTLYTGENSGLTALNSSWTGTVGYKLSDSFPSGTPDTMSLEDIVKGFISEQNNSTYQDVFPTISTGGYGVYPSPFDWGFLRVSEQKTYFVFKAFYDKFTEKSIALIGTATAGYKWFYTFSSYASYWSDDNVYDATVDNNQKAFDNIIKAYNDNENKNKQLLNNIVSIGNFYKNTFAKCCHNMTFGGCYGNSFGINCHDNSFGWSCNSNSFGDECSNNSFGIECSNNSFGYGCSSNSFNEKCYDNLFGNECDNNSLDECCKNTFANNVSGISFIGCEGNSVGIQCSNLFGFYCNNNSFDNKCNNISLDSDCLTNTFGKGCHDIVLDSCQRNSFKAGCYNISLLHSWNYNSFESGCSNILLNGWGYCNSFGINCYDITIGSEDECCGNSFGNGCFSITLESYNFCKNNSFGNECSYIRFSGDTCYGNSFANYCTNIELGGNCYANSFGSQCNGISLEYECAFNSFGNFCASISLGIGCQNNSFGNDCYGYKKEIIFGNNCSDNTVLSGVSGINLPAETKNKVITAYGISSGKEINVGNTHLIVDENGVATLNGAQILADDNLSLGITIDSNYVATFTLTDTRSGTQISSANIDLPLETMVVGGSYDNTTKDLTLTLKNGNTVIIPLDNIISGLVNETQLDEALEQLKQAIQNGNVASATKLQTARKINGVAFDGTKDIIIETTPECANITALIYKNTRVPASMFQSDTTYAEYPYMATIPLNKATANMFATVTFDKDNADRFAPYYKTYDGGIYIWSKTNENATIPQIRLEEAEVINNGGSDGIVYTSNNNGTCSVSGIGTCTDTDIVIPSISPDYEVVTSIGKNAFRRCTSFTNITIPDGATSIDDYAFYYCTSLESITIPDSVTSIGNQVFYNCSLLASITFKGTSIQWNSITKGSSWEYKVPATEVICSDGTVII